MKTWTVPLVAVLGLSTCLNGYAAWKLMRFDEVQFPSFNKSAITMFNGNAQDGSLVVTGLVPGQRTALDLWPHNGPLPERHALSEQVWYRTRFRDWPTFERMSISAMASTTRFGPHYRLSIEHGGTGQSLPFIFCFDSQSVGEMSYCPLRLDPKLGVLLCDKSDVCKNIGD
jgi:hypothetical protein